MKTRGILLILFLSTSLLFPIDYTNKYAPEYKEYNLTVEYDGIIMGCEISIFHMLEYYTIDFFTDYIIEGHSIIVETVYSIDGEEFEGRYDLVDRRAYELKDNPIEDVTIKSIEFVDTNGEVYYAVLNQAIYSLRRENGISN